MKNMLVYRDGSGVLRCVTVLGAGLAFLLIANSWGWGADAPPLAGAHSALDEFGALAQDIRQAVQGVKYSGQVAQDFVELVREWDLVDLKRELVQVGAACPQGRVSQTQTARAEEQVAGQLGRRIRDRIRCSPVQFELTGVVRDKAADCLGFAQVLYILGNSLGLSVNAICVRQLAGVAGDLPPGSSHVACLVELADGKTMMVDPATAGPALVSKPFRLQEAYEERHDYLHLKSEMAASGLHRRFRVLDKNGLVACVYDNRGNEHNQQGTYAQAVEVLTEALELDPKCVGAYNNRGIAWHRLGKVGEAIADYTQAVEFDPTYGEAYYNRGNLYGTLGDFPKAISDYTRAIELDQKYTWAYANRGNAYFNLTRYREAIADHSKAVDLDPSFAEAYSNRGNAYKSLGKYEQAIADHTKAIELKPGYSGFYFNRAIAYCKLGRSEAGKRDLRNAVELDPELKSRVNELGRHFKLNLGF